MGPDYFIARNIIYRCLFERALIFFLFPLAPIYLYPVLLIGAVLNNFSFFVLLHDLAHYIFFPKFQDNEFWGQVVSAITRISFTHWRATHNEHHAKCNTLDFHIQQTGVVTVQEFREFPWYKRLIFRTVYSKYIFYPLVSWIYVYFVNRFVGTFREFCLVGLYNLIIYCIGGAPLLIFDFLAIVFSSIIEFILLHNQHTFEGAARKSNVSAEQRWDLIANGSTIINVPFWLKRVTLGVEYHAVHHLYPKIPCYRLESFYQQNYTLFSPLKHIFISEMLNNIGCILYDQETGKFVSC